MDLRRSPLFLATRNVFHLLLDLTQEGSIFNCFQDTQAKNVNLTWSFALHLSGKNQSHTKQQNKKQQSGIAICLSIGIEFVRRFGADGFTIF
jgi:hypothetical protein